MTTVAPQYLDLDNPDDADRERQLRAEAEAEDALDLEGDEDVNEDGSRYMGAEAHDFFYSDLGVKTQ